MNPQAGQSLYLEDVYVGQQFRSASFDITEQGIKAFAAEFDPQPFHLDQAAAQNSVFRGLAASGWHTAAVTMRLLVTGGLPLATGTIGLGGEIDGRGRRAPATRCTSRARLWRSILRDRNRIRPS